LVPETLQAIKGGSLDYTIDQQPYLQGFLPVLYLYMYKLSGGLVFPSQTNTGLLFVTKDTVDPYLQTKTRFEGSSTEQQGVQRPAATSGRGWGGWAPPPGWRGGSGRLRPGDPLVACRGASARRSCAGARPAFWWSRSP